MPEVERRVYDLDVLLEALEGIGLVWLQVGCRCVNYDPVYVVELCASQAGLGEVRVGVLRRFEGFLRRPSLGFSGFLGPFDSSIRLLVMRFLIFRASRSPSFLFHNKVWRKNNNIPLIS